MGTFIIQIVVLLVLIFMVFIVMKVSGFVGGKDKTEIIGEKRIGFLDKFKKEEPDNKTVQVNDWSIVELDDVGYPTGHASEICFTEGKFYIGRDKSNDFVLENMTVSGKHAVILDTPKGFILKNEKSSANGVKHNGKAVEEIRLVDGMILQFGKVFCKFMLNDEQGGALFDDGLNGHNDWNNYEETVEKKDYIQRKL